MVSVEKLVTQKVGRLREKIGDPVGGALISAVLVFIIMLGSGWQASQWYQNRLIEERKAQVTAEASLRANALSAAIHRRFALAEGLSAFVKAEHKSENFAEMFELFAAGLYSSTPGIRNIALAPHGVMAYVYPLEGNESVIGYEPLQDSRPEIRQDVQRALTTREIILSGPTDLLQGGKGLIVRQAVYLDDGYWGLVNLVIDLPPILERAGFDTESPSEDLGIALRDAGGRLIYGSEAVFANDTIAYGIQLPEGEWHLAILPAQGWTASVLDELRVFQVGGAVIALLLTSLTYLVVNRQASLSLAVQERTSELSRVNEQLAADIANRERMANALRASEERLLSLLAVAPDAIIAVDEHQNIIVFNQAAERMFGYSADEVLYKPLGLLLPHRFGGPHALHVSNFIAEAAITRRMDERLPIWGRRRDGSEFPAEASISKLVENGHVTLTAIVRDITRRKQMEIELREREEMLEKRVAQRTRELQTLLDVSRKFAAILDFEPLLDQLYAQLKAVVDYSALTLSMVENAEELVLVEYRGPLSREQMPQRWRQSNNSTRVDLISLREPIIIPDVHADTPQAIAWRAGAAQNLGQIPEYVSSWMAVPLMVKNQTIGLLIFDHATANYYTHQHAEVALALANNAAIAIENARLFRTVQRGIDQFKAISELGHHITSILDIDELLSQTVHLIQDAFGYYHVHIGLIQGDEISFPDRAGVWEAEAHCAHCATLHLLPGPETICGAVVDSGKPVMVPDISKEPRYLHPTGATGSGVVVPLKVKGQVIGLLDVESREINDFDESDAAVLQLLANQVAVAIENARLYEKAQYLAALQERQKLARELHDSVSQALYGLALGTRTARTLLDKDPEKAVEPLEYCLALAEAGLAEMRALIFELRPESLEKEGLVAALSKQSAAFRARHNIEVETELCHEPNVPLNVKEALYRVTQEAMHNTIKHAKAARVQLEMRCEDHRLDLWVRDDGIGFNPLDEFPGHLGLKSMRERVERLGGGLDIVSLPGQGAKIHAWIPIV